MKTADEGIWRVCLAAPESKSFTGGVAEGRYHPCCRNVKGVK